MTALQPDFFGAAAAPAPAGYPDAPGWKRQATSRAAAEGIAPKAKSLRERVLEAIRLHPGTPEDIARRLGEPVLNVRPRTSELFRAGLIERTGITGKALGGREAIIWRAVQP